MTVAATHDEERKATNSMSVQRKSGVSGMSNLLLMQPTGRHVSSEQIMHTTR